MAARHRVVPTPGAVAIGAYVPKPDHKRGTAPSPSTATRPRPLNRLKPIIAPQPALPTSGGVVVGAPAPRAASKLEPVPKHSIAPSPKLPLLLNNHAHHQVPPHPLPLQHLNQRQNQPPHAPLTPGNVVVGQLAIQREIKTGNATAQLIAPQLLPPHLPCFSAVPRSNAATNPHSTTACIAVSI